MAEAFRGVLGKPQGFSGLDIHHPPVIQVLAPELPGLCRLKGGREGQVRAAVQHDVAHFLPGRVPVYQIDRMVVKQLDTVFVQLFCYGSNVIVKQGEYRQPVPAEVGAEKHGCGDICFGKTFCPCLDPVQVFAVRPLQVGPVYPPAGNALVLIHN